MICELCNQKPAIYNVQVRPLQEPETGKMLVGKGGTPSLGDIVIRVNVCEKCLPFEVAREKIIERKVMVRVRV